MINSPGLSLQGPSATPSGRAIARRVGAVEHRISLKSEISPSQSKFVPTKRAVVGTKNLDWEGKEIGFHRHVEIQVLLGSASGACPSRTHQEEPLDPTTCQVGTHRFL